MESAQRMTSPGLRQERADEYRQLPADIPPNNELYEPEPSDTSPQLPDLIDAIRGTTRSHNQNKS